jgi:hypothetical protein
MAVTRSHWPVWRCGEGLAAPLPLLLCCRCLANGEARRQARHERALSPWSGCAGLPLCVRFGLIRLCGAVVACRVRSDQAMAAAFCVAVTWRNAPLWRTCMAGQPGRGARHNASFREPEGREAQRSG